MYKQILKNYRKIEKKESSIKKQLKKLDNRKEHRSRDYWNSKDKEREKPNNRLTKRRCKQEWHKHNEIC